MLNGGNALQLRKQTSNNTETKNIRHVGGGAGGRIRVSGTQEKSMHTSDALVAAPEGASVSLELTKKT